MPSKRPALKKPSAKAKHVPSKKKPAAKSSKKPAGCRTSVSPDSMGTTLSLPGLSHQRDGEVGAVGYREIVFPLPDEVVPASLPGPLPYVDLDDDREPSSFAQQHAPHGWLMEWDLMSREQQLYVWAHHDSLDLYPTTGGHETPNMFYHSQKCYIDGFGFQWYSNTCLLGLVCNGIGDSHAHHEEQDAPTLNALFPPASSGSLQVDSNGIIRGVQA